MFINNIRLIICMSSFGITKQAFLEGVSLDGLLYPEITAPSGFSHDQLYKIHINVPAQTIEHDGKKIQVSEGLLVLPVSYDLDEHEKTVSLYSFFLDDFVDPNKFARLSNEGKVHFTDWENPDIVQKDAELSMLHRSYLLSSNYYVHANADLEKQNFGEALDELVRQYFIVRDNFSSGKIREAYHNSAFQDLFLENYYPDIKKNVDDCLWDVG